MVVTETWLGDKDSHNKVQLPGYHQAIKKDRTTDQAGGVAIYVKDNLAEPHKMTWTLKTLFQKKT